MENPTKAQDRKWLIIFLIYADFTTKKSSEDLEKLKITINNMLCDIITTPVDPDRSRIFVVMNSIKFVFNEPDNVINDKSVFYTIQRNVDGTQNCIADCKIIDNREFYKKEDDADSHVLQKTAQLKAILKKT